MSEETKVSEKQAVRDAFEEEVRLMFRCLLDALVQDSANKAEPCKRFRKGMDFARKAFELANNVISE